MFLVGFEPATHELKVRCGYQLRYRNVLLLMLKGPRNTFHFLALLSQPYVYIIAQIFRNVKFSKVRIEKFELSILAPQVRYLYYILIICYLVAAK